MAGLFRWAVLAVGAAALLTPDLQSGVGSHAGPCWEPSLLVELHVSDLDRSIRFYTETLGFKLTERRDDLQFAHIDCGVAGPQIGLSAGANTPPNPGSVVLNFGVKGDVETSRRALEAKGVVFRGPTVVVPGKVRFAEFRDPDGHAVRLAGEDR